MGRWNRFVAQEFLNWLDPPSGQRWLDVGCGTGALSESILNQTSPAQVTAVDPSNAFIAFARQSVSDSRVEFRIGNALDLPVESNTFDAVVSGLALNFMPDLLTALTEMGRAVLPDGLIAVYVWNYAGKMEMLRYFWDAAIAIDPAAETLDQGLRFPLCQPAALEELFTGTNSVNPALWPVSDQAT